ncbi:MAG: hypothetical protein ACKVS6_11050 [Planctomycetota bacterium]
MNAEPQPHKSLDSGTLAVDQTASAPALATIEVCKKRREEIGEALANVRRRNRIAAFGLLVSCVIAVSGVVVLWIKKSNESTDSYSLKFQSPVTFKVSPRKPTPGVGAPEINSESPTRGSEDAAAR